MADRAAVCARPACCQLPPPSDEGTLATVTGRVVREMLERAIEAPLPSGDFLARTTNVGVAISSALRAEMERRRSAVEEHVAWPDGSLRVVNNSADDYVWVDRYQVVKEPERTALLDFVVGGGLCVVTNGRGSWIVHSPAMQCSVTP